jgi:Xaa-Pro aminopeptidase
MTDPQIWLDQDEPLFEALRAGGPMNLPRAYEVMERFGLDGIVVGDPLNVFHMLGYYPQIGLTRVGQPPTTFAILARDQRQAPAIVSSHFIYYYTFADGGQRANLQSYLYRDAGDIGTEAVLEGFKGMIADRGTEPQSEVEQRRDALTAAALAIEPIQENAGGALVRALKAMGLWNGAIAFDHAVIREVTERHERPGTLVAGDNVLRWIRIKKSPLELELMRRGAGANADAVNAVVAQLRAGASYSETRRNYAIESARRGNRAVFMTIDRVSSELPTMDRIRDGQTLFLDGVGHFQNYHGDYARTVFVGEPSAAARRGAAAVTLGWQAIREQLRPGLAFAEIAEIGRAALRKAGVADVVGFGPHSVGLMHSDEPGRESGGFYTKHDLFLEEDMVLSVDCPVLETGIGGSVHIEDLVVITADGAEPIHAVGDHVLTV